ncbi:hypothetical protein HOP52_13430 [Halomonas campisalis]|uniref:Uncharacterized protein n=1 Tax=Billgrantia campisalis TaxID=74661 RepID=A0ABS9PAH8_9GAMM|nr:hypothetical protein [Halomonas campisalis]MCG6658756.1 hypothetical protein [Halomonas campisalis]MDR5864862.1 hypothetical protein [Halomonas campisalis]
MTEQFELEMSPLSQSITAGEKTIQVDIYRGDNGGWILEVIDESNSSLVWDDEFESDSAALDEVKRTIKADGFDSLIS